MRKSPVRHQVSGYTRGDGTWVGTYNRGSRERPVRFRERRVVGSDKVELVRRCIDKVWDENYSFYEDIADADEVEIDFKIRHNEVYLTVRSHSLVGPFVGEATSTYPIDRVLDEPESAIRVVVRFASDDMKEKEEEAERVSK